MKRTIYILTLAALLIGCGKKSDEPKANTNDSLLTKTMKTDSVMQPPPDPLTGLYIDRSRLRTPEHEALLARFNPDQIVDIYHYFRPLRKASATKEEVDEYLKKKKITLEELKAVLEEGDRLGWSKSPQ